MGGNYLCTAQRARHPFYIESIGINIYSAEELCFYLYHYVYLIDETVISERLCNWISEELKLERVAALMLRSLHRNEDANAFFLPLLQECRYLSREQIGELQEEISRLQVESEDVRGRKKADHLLRFEMYVSAISEYERILEKKNDNGRLSMQFYAEVLENMATAYARLFHFEEAAEYLWESFQCVRSRKVYEKYLKVLPLFMSEERYKERIAEIRASETDAARTQEETKTLLLEGLQSDLASRWEEENTKEQIENLKYSYVHNTTGTR